MGVSYYICWVCGLPLWCCILSFTSLFLQFHVYYCMGVFSIYCSLPSMTVVCSTYWCYVIWTCLSAVPLGFVRGEPESSSAHPVQEPTASPGIQRKSCIMSKRPWFFLILSTSLSVFPLPALRTFLLSATLPPQQYRPWNSEKVTSSATLTVLL